MLTLVRQAFGLVDSALRPWILVCIAAALLGSLLEAAGLAGLFLFFQVAMDPVTFGGFALLQELHGRLGEPDEVAFISLLAAATGFAFVFRVLLLAFAQWLALSFQRRLQVRLTASLFRAYLRQPLQWHLAQGQARLINNVAANIDNVCQGIIVAGLDIVASILAILLIVTGLIMLQPVGALASIVLILLFASFFVKIMRPMLSQWSRIGVEAAEWRFRAIREALKGIKTVKVMGRTEFFAREVDTATDVISRMGVRRNLLAQVPRLGLEAMIVVVILGGIIVTLNLDVPISELIPTMALFAAAAVRMVPQATAIVVRLQQIRLNEAPLAAIRDHLTDDTAGPVEPADGASTANSVEFRELRLERIQFAYSGSASSVAALREAALCIGQGELVALVGPSGAGKTTLVDVILGLLEPQAGRLLLDGQPVDRFPPALFAYVPQDSFVVHASLRQNITFGLADVAEAHLQAIIRRTGLSGLVERLPRGLDTVLGEEGSSLSGGEKQRIGIARALVRDAPIVVLDEPTSALDATTEATVTETIEALRGSRSVIMIAHRLSSIQRFDRIVFMTDGRIRAQGRFEEVYRVSPEFAHMVDIMALGGYAPADEAGAGEARIGER